MELIGNQHIDNRSKPLIHVVAVAYKRFGEIKTFVQSWLNQTNKNWKLTVIHDGHDHEFEEVMGYYRNIDSERINYFCSDKRYNDYGHTLRDIGLKHVDGEYVLLTNADNYFIPKAVEFIQNELSNVNADIVLFDMVHSHQNPGISIAPSYCYFQVSYAPNKIDVSSAVVKSELAQKVGFRDKSFAGDITYFMDIQSLKSNLNIVKIPRILFVHN